MSNEATSMVWFTYLLLLYKCQIEGVREECQHNGNANMDVPNTYGALLEGEWIGYASSQTSDPKGNKNALNAAVEHANGSCERSRLAEVNGAEPGGCNGGVGMRVC